MSRIRRVTCADDRRAASHSRISRCVFFQAEDGIRDLVRSRGLGDVYKRQVLPRRRLAWAAWNYARAADTGREQAAVCLHYLITVSYTHLTLPTSDLV